MKNLDNLTQIRKLDKSRVAKSIELLGKQCQQVWQEIKNIQIPKSYQPVTNIVVNGMGGSALGSHIIRSLYIDQLKIPMRIIHSYTLPAGVNSKTLYIASSYSGNTEEVLATIKEAVKRRTKILVICSGGKLARLKKQYNLPGYVFEPKYNPCNQPRIGLGYSILSQWLLLQKVGLLKLSPKNFKMLINYLDKLQSRFGITQKTANNPAKKLAENLAGKIPVIVTAEFLSGNAHTFSNQLNENAKNFAVYFLISEMNHHLLEGLAYPKSNQKTLHFVFIESGLFYSRNQKRFQITKNVLQKNKIKYSSYRCQGQDKILQSFEVLLLGSYLSFYLAMLNDIDPAPVPWVGYFKEQLRRNSKS
jgi:glucose/mannose-6-phosphate isomerase